MNNLKNALESKANEKKGNTQRKLKQTIQAMMPQIALALPSVITPERFTRMALTAISSNSKLEQCTEHSFLGAMMNAAQLGLEPNTPLGQAYLIPYGNQCQFQIGYKGLIDLAHRSGEFTNIYAEVVYEKDEFDYELGLEPRLVHKPTLTDRGEPIYYYAVYKLKNGGFGFKIMSKEDVEDFRKKYSKAKNSPWVTNFDEMAKKTVLKQVLKYAPIKVEFARDVAQDETVKSKIKEDMSLVDDEIIDITPPENDDDVMNVDMETGELLED